MNFDRVCRACATKINYSFMCGYLATATLHPTISTSSAAPVKINFVFRLTAMFTLCYIHIDDLVFARSRNQIRRSHEIRV